MILQGNCRIGDYREEEIASHMLTCSNAQESGSKYASNCSGCFGDDSIGEKTVKNSEQL